MSNHRRPASSKGAPAAALLSKPAQPKIIEGEQVTTVAPSPAPVATVPLDEHQDKQRAYRELMARLAAEAPETTVVEVPVVVGPSAQERAERAAQEALGQYLADLAAMDPSEPVYVVGLRPPRPRYAGLMLEVGDVIPGAAKWPRLESWVRAGIVEHRLLSRTG